MKLTEKQQIILFWVMIFIALCGESIFSQSHNNKKQGDEGGKIGVLKADNYKPISLRTYFLEVTRLNNDTTLKYSDFLADKATLKADNYKLMIDPRGSVQAYKNFYEVFVYAGTNKEIKAMFKRIKKIKL